MVLSEYRCDSYLTVVEMGISWTSLLLTYVKSIKAQYVIMPYGPLKVWKKWGKW